MSGTDRGETVECPICEVSFDPTTAGGWCTNPDCGEWQHDDGETTGGDVVFSPTGDPDRLGLLEQAAAATEADEPTEPDDEATPASLVLDVCGRQLSVTDGDRVGRDVRGAMLDAGRSDDDAVRIHREHVRFHRGDDGFSLVDLGDNPTRLNDRLLEKGDRQPVAPGDELTLSEVVTVTVRHPENPTG